MALNSDWNDVMRSWKAPSEVAGSGPREVRLNGTGKFLVGLMLFLLAGGIGLNVFLSRQLTKQTAQRSALDGSHSETQATVTRHWRTGDKEDTPMVAYRFEYDGRIYHGSTSAPGKEWKDLEVGSPIAVRFVPANPLVNHPSAWDMQVMPKWAPWSVSAVLVAIAFLPISLVQRDKRLLRDGRASPARVTGHRRGKGDVTLLYDFPLPNGEVAKGRGGQTRTPLGVGSIITVLYDSENPKRNAPYPLKTTRVER
jgi:hypothetical protein